MPKAGKYEYPSRDLDDCIGYMEKAHKIANAFVISRDNFAKDIGLSPKGGGYGLILSSLAMYGLMDSGDGNVRYTDLAQKILFGQPDERTDSKNEAIRYVTLLADIFDRYGSNPTDDQIRHLLREKANVPISEEARIALDVGKLLKRNVQHFKPIGGEKKLLIGQGSGSGSRGNALVTLSYGTTTIDVVNKVTLGLAKKLLEDIESDIESNEKVSKQGQEQEK